MSNNLNPTELSEIFRALSHPYKLRIFEHMMAVDGAVVPTEVSIALGLTVSQVASCLKRMSENKLLTRCNSGRYVFYEIDKDILTTLEEYFKL